MNKKIIILLLLTVFLAGLLRLSLLDRYPVGFTPDEAAQGYTAYSILKTGKDEWGATLPLSPRSFGDFKPPLYTYLLLPSIAIFGLNEFAVRLPAAIFGILAILVTFLLTKELFKNSPFSYPLSLISSFLLAISPWHFQLTRGAFEASLLVFLIPLGLWLFLKSFEKKPVSLVLAAIPFGLSLFSYHSAKFFVPLLVIALTIWKLNEIKKVWQSFVYFLAILAIFLGLLALTSFTGGSTRALDVTIFNPTGGWGTVADQRFDAVKAGMPDLIARTFNNKLTFIVERLTKNYLQYFSLEFLFTNGPAEGFYGMLPGRGLLYLFELPLILFGLFVIFKKKVSSGKFLIVCLLLAPIPAALAKGPGYAANRAITMLPFWSILSAYGGIALWQEINKKLKPIQRKFLWLLAFLLVAVSLVFFLEDYFLHSPIVIAPPMRYGWRETIEFIQERQESYQEIVISRSLSEPQAYVMFYQQYNPKEVQRESADWLRYEEQGLLFLDQLGEYHLGKYTFRDLHFPVDKNLKKTLLVGQPQEFPVKINVLKAINYPNGKPAILIVDPEKI